jgi:hypothetical protein
MLNSTSKVVLAAMARGLQPARRGQRSTKPWAGRMRMRHSKVKPQHAVFQRSKLSNWRAPEKPSCLSAGLANRATALLDVAKSV